MTRLATAQNRAIDGADAFRMLNLVLDTSSKCGRRRATFWMYYQPASGAELTAIGIWSEHTPSTLRGGLIEHSSKTRRSCQNSGSRRCRKTQQRIASKKIAYTHSAIDAQPMVLGYQKIATDIRSLTEKLHRLRRCLFDHMSCFEVPACAQDYLFADRA